MYESSVDILFLLTQKKKHQKESSQPGTVATKCSSWAWTVVAATLPMLHEEGLC